MKGLLVAAMLWTASAAAGQEMARDPAERNCAADAVELMILGSYHMDNPGLDAVNVHADDVLTPRRQAEIAEVNAALARFRPTKVAVEGDRSRNLWPERYAAWLAGEYRLGRNEIEQIGMKVARAAGLDTIHPIDFPMMMSGLRYDEVELRRPAAGEAGSAAEPPQLTEAERLLRRSTVGEILRRANDPERIAAGQLEYMALLEPDPDDPALYARSDHLLNWYKRNIRMMANVARISEPGDRVLLVVGSGHLAILRDFAIDSAGFCLADTLHYLP